MQTSDKRIRILIIVAGAALLVVTTFLLFKPSPKKADTATGKTSVYHDPVSGEDIINQKGKVPETQGSTPTEPLFAGFDKLLQQGMALDQLQALYAAFEAYKPFASNNTQISLAANDITSIKPLDSDPLYRWSFKSHIVVDRKTSYQVQIYYWGLSAIELHIYNSTGSTQLFNSATVDNSTAIGD